MASPFTVMPVLGVDLNTTALAVDIANGSEDAPQLGTQVFASDGRRYMYGQAGAAIAANTAVCLPSVTTFIVAASGGSYRSPPVAMAVGDRGYFSVASV
jgi:hypothetical protein